MTRAEKAALEAYPIKGKWIGNQYGEWDGDVNITLRAACLQGYEQAEKDLALTIADIYRIHVFLCAVKNNKQGAFTFQRLKDEQYQDVLEKFNKAKEDEQ